MMKRLLFANLMAPSSRLNSKLRLGSFHAVRLVGFRPRLKMKLSKNSIPPNFRYSLLALVYLFLDVNKDYFRSI